MHKLAQKPQKVNAEVIGLDVHKRLIVFSHLNRKGEEVACGKIGPHREDLEHFLRKAIGRKKSHVVFEASRSSLWVYALAVSIVGPDRVHVAQARKIRVIANSQDKNDFNDAWWLAYLTQEDRLPEAYVPPAEILELRIACRERHALVRRRAQVMTRLRSHLAQIGFVITASSLHTAKARHELDQALKVVPGIRRTALSGCLREMDFLTEEIAEWEKRVADLAVALPEVQALRDQAPGVGEILAAMIVGEAGDIGRFRRVSRRFKWPL